MRSLLVLAAVPAVLAAANIKGTVLDPSGAAIPGAQIAAVNRIGLVAQTTSDYQGSFELKVAEPAGARLVVTAAGFETRNIPLESASEVRLNIAAQTDTVRVAGSTMDVPLREQGGVASVIAGQEIRGRNEPLAVDLLRYLPGLALSQAGGRGGVTGLFTRGGNYNFNLVQVDGVPVNAFGGAYDFAHVPAELLERIEVIRGPQSAVYGPYANSGVVNFVTRSPEESPLLELLAEGGTYQERRFAIGSAGTVGGFGLAAFATRMDSDGPVANSDYRNESVSLRVTRGFRRQSLALSGLFDSNEIGVPGPYGSNPQGIFTGIDLVSRNKSNFSSYLAHYQADLTPRVRQELFGTFFLNNSFFRCGCGDWFDKNLRGQAETRTVVSVAPIYTLAFGASLAREQVKNTYVSDSAFRAFPLRRDSAGLYWENRFQIAGRFFWNAGLRGDVIRTPRVPPNTAFERPEFPGHTMGKVNPKLAAAFVWRAARLHASFGTGFRPAAGLEIAFTNNPALKPERTTSFDAGIEQKLWRGRLSLDGTYFYNRFYDLIVSLGGTLARLSSYRSDNLANSRAQGAEVTLRVRPARWVSLDSSYTYLKSEILSLDGSSGVAPAFFRVGQQLLRRPKHSGTFVSTFAWRSLSANVTGYLRGPALDVEPNYGAFAGFYRSPGYANAGVNLNYRLRGGMILYGNLRNALNRKYEEVYGFPSPRLNFVAGVRWTLGRGR